VGIAEPEKMNMKRLVKIFQLLSMPIAIGAYLLIPDKKTYDGVCG